MAEKFTERSVGILLPLAFYAAGGMYMVAFWLVFDRAAYHLAIMGGVSIIFALGLYAMSRWVFWLGLFTFPLFFAEFAYALVASVNLVGWNPNIMTALFHASILVYLVFLSMSLILLIDRRNTLRSDRILERLHRPRATEKSPTASKSDST